MENMNRYCYDEPVCEFDICIAKIWLGETMAVNEKKARSNLTYQFKKQNNKVPNTRISLPGKIVMM